MQTLSYFLLGRRLRINAHVMDGGNGSQRLAVVDEGALPHKVMRKKQRQRYAGST
jgi:hypothetical protein